MGRPLASLVVLALFVGAIGASWAFEPVDAQDTTEGRLAALETRVAEQDDTISGHGREIERLENRVEDLEDDAADGGSGAASGGGDAGSGDGGAGGVNLSFEGSTDAISETFVVGPGTLRFDAVY